MWYHLQQLWHSSRILQIAVIAGAVGLAVLAISSNRSAPQPVVNGTVAPLANTAAQAIQTVTGSPIAPPIPSVPAGTLGKAQNTAKRAVDVTGKAVDAAETAIDTSRKVIDVGSQVVDQFLGGSPPSPQPQSSAPPPGNQAPAAGVKPSSQQ